MDIRREIKEVSLFLFPEFPTMRELMRLPFVIFVAVFCLGALSLRAQRSDTIAKINPANVLVNDFQGWGVSLCWWANVVGGYSNRVQYADLIFKGLKLNIVRYSIGGGENPAGPGTIQFRAMVPGFEPKRGVWDWNADRNQRWMLKAALVRGVN
ncbi:MAG TPA: hypothetical protein VGV18_01200, partial [Verrucomicrobiae bacterium]|nr:hypothetical protein [Verrucomicrobiae bacterium]